MSLSLVYTIPKQARICPSRAHVTALQAFVDEMVDIAKAEWLKDYYTTGDKKGLIAKVKGHYIASMRSHGEAACTLRFDLVI